MMVPLKLELSCYAIAAITESAGEVVHVKTQVLVAVADE